MGACGCPRTRVRSQCSQKGGRGETAENPPVSEGRPASMGVVQVAFLEEVAFALGLVGGGFSQIEEAVPPSDGVCDSKCLRGRRWLRGPGISSF